ncbi:Ig-like domain-containing protein [Eisenibacter elegans]|jgi:hypothetical protein|uniref:Ig-like domain-containing protein n=1 Tax=Eisenibacter elegans TaxID=997 RepID=UPI00047AB46F|nr:Ig-like domain-containing protein [Eisenibacter elegans]
MTNTFAHTLLPTAFTRSLLWGFLGLIATLLVQACANRIPPTGGDLDEVPPVIKYTNPAPNTTNFNGESITLEFDEWIKEENLKQQLIIIPEIKYRHRVSKRSLKLSFEKPLEPNTTYSLSFREGLKDITEGNVPPDLRFAFSTGDKLDTAIVRGRTANLRNNKPTKDVLIAFVKPGDTIQLDKSTPRYYTISNEDGTFLMPNLASEEFEVYAYHDRNSNKKYDEGEAIAFLETPIQLSDSVFANMQLALAPEDHNPPRLRGISPIQRYLELEFDEGLANFALDSANTDLRFIVNRDAPTKVLIFPPTDSSAIRDTIPTLAVVRDSADNVARLPLKLKFRVPDTEKKNSQKSFDLTIKAAGGEGEALRMPFGFRIYFSKPVAEVDYSKIRFIREAQKPSSANNWADKIAQRYTNTSPKVEVWSPSGSLFVWDDNRSALRWDTLLPIKKGLELRIEEGAFISIEQDSSALVSKVFNLLDENKLGSISGTIQSQAAHYFIELMKNDGQIVDRLEGMSQSQDFEFRYVRSGEYQIRITIDNNNNNRWDGSDFRKKIPAEKVLYFPLPNRVREGWDIQGLQIEF